MADRTTIDAFDRLSLKAERLRHLTGAMVALDLAGEQETVAQLTRLAEDLAADVCHLIKEAGQASARALTAAG